MNSVALSKRDVARRRMALAARLIVGAVLLTSGILKLSSPAEELAYAMESYRLLPVPWLMLLARVLPWAESLVGALLLTGVFARFCALAAATLFAVFIVALASVLIRRIPLAECGCFGDLIHWSPGQALTADLLFFILCCLAYWAARSKTHRDDPLEKKT